MIKALLWTSGVLFGLGLGACAARPGAILPELDPAVVSAATWEGEWPLVVESGRLYCGPPDNDQAPSRGPLPTYLHVAWFVDPDGNWWALNNPASMWAVMDAAGKLWPKNERYKRIGNARLVGFLAGILRGRGSDGYQEYLQFQYIDDTPWWRRMLLGLSEGLSGLPAGTYERERYQRAVDEFLLNQRARQMRSTLPHDFLEAYLTADDVIREGGSIGAAISELQSRALTLCE